MQTIYHYSTKRKLLYIWNVLATMVQGDETLTIRNRPSSPYIDIVASHPPELLFSSHQQTATRVDQSNLS